VRPGCAHLRSVARDTRRRFADTLSRAPSALYPPVDAQARVLAVMEASPLGVRYAKSPQRGTVGVRRVRGLTLGLDDLNMSGRQAWGATEDFRTKGIASQAQHSQQAMPRIHAAKALAGWTAPVSYTYDGFNVSIPADIIGVALVSVQLIAMEPLRLVLVQNAEVHEMLGIKRL
jgi:hypothetical protein